jgi:glycosyltransferase involved in cell wall biosynthesis
VGLVARVDPLKGHQDFLEAARRQDPGTHFLLAGLDVEKLDDRGLEGRLHRLGPRTDVPRVLAALDLFALTSLSEAFPNVLGEAMACGLPAVVTDVGDAAWILQDNGVVVPPGDADAIAAGWRQLLALTPAERQQLGHQARDRILAEFSLASVRHRYEKMYQDVANQEALACAE